MAQLEDGGYAMVGYSSWDMVVWRTDAQGELMWSYTDEGSQIDVGKDVIVIGDGSIVALGGNRSENPPLDDVILLILGEQSSP